MSNWAGGFLVVLLAPIWVPATTVVIVLALIVSLSYRLFTGKFIEEGLKE